MTTGYISGMQRTLFESFDEFTDLMIDMTFKFASSTTGQVPHGSAGPRTGEETNGVMNCKGRSGVLLSNGAAHGESFEEQSRCLLDAVPGYARGSTITISSDAPEKLLSQVDLLRAHFPDLEAICKEMSHVKIRVLKHSNMKPSTASGLIHSAAVGMFFVPHALRDGEQYRWKASAAEQTDSIEGFADGEQMDQDAAGEKLRMSGEGAVEVTARAWGLCCGAVAVLAGVAGDDDSGLRATLRNQAKRFPFLRNSSIRRSKLTAAQLREAPSGTSSLEALHREMRTWGVSVWRLQSATQWSSVHG